MDEWGIIWQQKELFLSGFMTTIYLFLASSLASFIIGLGLLFTLENARDGVKSCVGILIIVMRTLPFLILAYLLYYGLPQLGVRMSATNAGLLALTIYHGTYFCEIFRSIRRGLDPGYVEAADAFGFSKSKIFTRVIAPNVLLKSIPLVTNQLIVCLKDTAFLSIITVEEVTAAANSIQSTYFIPLTAFVVAIALYWLLSIALEQVTKHLLIQIEQKGLSHA